MKPAICIIMILSLFSLGWTLAAEPPISPKAPSQDKTRKPPTKLTPLMQMKLDKSKAIVEGLAMEDFGKIKSNARSLRLLSAEAGWNVIQTKEYAAQSRDFQRAADLIVQAADSEDIHRAALGYVALTVRCVECHSYMRKHRIELTMLDSE